MLLDRIDTILDEINYNDRINSGLINYSMDELVGIISEQDEKGMEELFSNIDDETKQRLEKLKEGGLLWQD
jgi:hypothetical protein